MTHAESLAERIRIQARSAGISPERLLLDELLDMNRLYMVVLETLHKESQNVDRARRGSPDGEG